MKLGIGIVLAALYLLAIACTSVNQIVRRNLSYIYSTAPNSLHPEFVVYHKSEEKSVLYFRISRAELLYIKPNKSIKYTGGIKFSYKLIADFGDKNMTDSASVIKADSTTIMDYGEIIDSVSFNAFYPNQYQLYLSLTDLNKKNTYEAIIKVDKSNVFGAQNFLIRAANRQPAFKNYFASNDQIIIEVNNPKYKKAYVRHFNNQFPPAAPPYTDVKENTIKLKTDTVFSVNFNNGVSKRLSFIQTGIYFLQIDSTIKKGLAVYRFYKDFPEITNTLQMLYPLIYMTSKNEYERILYAKDKKLEIDNFWYEIAGNPDRARQLIKRYYSKVTEANLFFTSYLPGWMTDRGIIYIIYGTPNTVNKTGELETWYYGTPQNLKSIVFYFYRVDNPFTDNDYNLVRSENYKNSWYLAIEAWRR